jgi:DNA-directed RNA polymerase specialized sigma24 family protein
MEPLEQDAMIRKYDYLVRACAARLGVHNDDDALQCGLIGLWEACRAWDGKRSFAPMARRCITHNIIDMPARPKARRTAPDGLPDDAERRAGGRAEFWASARSQCTLREYRTLD